MLKEYRESNKYTNVLSKVISQVEKAGYTEIRADHPDHTPPAKLVNQKNQDIFIPDVTAHYTNGGLAYFEIAKKSGDSTKLVNKWQLLATLAELKHGIFKIFVPHGSMRFTQELINRYNINAELTKI